MTAITIRKAKAADVPMIGNCARSAYARYVAAIGREPAPMVADFAAQVAAGDVDVAERDGEIVGFIVFFARDGTMFLENVAVHPGAAGQGIGKALVARCEDAARRANLPAVVLYTNAKMTGNLAIYPRLGYVETDRRIEDGFDRVYFRKEL